MASIYKKGKYIYISWYDPGLGKTVNRSTSLKYSRENLKKAKEISKAIQDKLDSTMEQFKKLGIKRVTIESAMEHYLENNSDKNPKTIYEYKNFIKRFSQTFPKDSSCSIINKLSSEKWLNEIKKLPLEQNSKFSICKNLKKFLNFLFEYNYIPYFKLNKDVLVKMEVKEIVIFSAEDIKKLFNNLNEKNSNFRTAIYLMFFTGLRPTDILYVKVKDIDLENKTMKYFSQKTKDAFIVPLHEDLLPVLIKRIEEVKSGRIFEYSTGNEIGRAFRRYLKKIDLTDKNYTLRTFRKTFISLAHEHGIDLATVSKIVGHKRISTTAKFYHKLDISKQSDELKKFKININELK